VRGDDIDLGGDDDGDGDFAVDDEDVTYPHAKRVPVEMTVSNLPRWKPWSSRINPRLEKKRIIASDVVLENSMKIRASLFPWYGALVKRRRRSPHHAARKLGHVVGPILSLTRSLVSPLRSVSLSTYVHRLSMRHQPILSLSWPPSNSL
jgi:hypothetical protein